MKFIILISLLFFYTNSFATRGWYFANTGNDIIGNGTVATPYQTVSKANSLSATMVAGDSILFNSGDTFRDTALLIPKGGTVSLPIIIGAYGTGAMPIITSYYNITTWTSTGTNLWQSEVIPMTSVSPYIVLENSNTPSGMGRWPNSDSLNSGYRVTTDTVAGLTTTTLKDINLPASPDWTGATLVVKTQRWIIDILQNVTVNNTTHVVTHSATSSGQKSVGIGYFFENDIRTLDKVGEWYYDTTLEKLTIYSIGAPTNVRIATRDNLIYNNSGSSVKNYVTITGLDLQGCNGNAYDFFGNFSGTKILNCNFLNVGNTSIRMPAYNTLIQDNTITNSLNNGIEYVANDSIGIIRGNTIKNTSLIPGLGRSGESKGDAIIVMSKDLIIDSNYLSNTGYCNVWINATVAGIKPVDSITIQYNEMDSFNVNKNDGACIYLTGRSGTPQYARKFNHNYIHDGFNNTNGTNPTFDITYGLYFDAYKVGGIVDSNFFTRCSKAAVFVNNRASNITFTGNTFYNDSVYQLELNLSKITDSLNLTIKKNIFWSSGTQLNVSLSFDTAAVPPYVIMDSNYFANLITNTSPYKLFLSPTSSNNTITQWRTKTGYDINSSLLQFLSTDVIAYDFNLTPSPYTVPLLGYFWNDAKGNIFQNGINPLVLQTYTGAVRQRGALVPVPGNGGIIIRQRVKIFHW